MQSMNFFIGAFCFLGNLYIMKKFEFLCSFPCGETEGFIYLDVSLMNKISEHEDDHHIVINQNFLFMEVQQYVSHLQKAK